MARVWYRTERGPIQGKHQEGTNDLGKPGSAGRSARAEGYMRRRRRAARIAPSLFCECSFRRALRMWFRTVCELRLSSPAICPVSSPKDNRRKTYTSRMDKGLT